MLNNFKILSNPIKVVVVLFTLVFLCSCKDRKNTADIPPPVRTNQIPTATEVFQMRSECASLGQKILNKNIVGIALTQSQLSNYNPKTNRCYVELTVQTADLSKEPEVMSRYLYDGQTEEMLAYTTIEKGKEPYNGTITTGQKRAHQTIPLQMPYFLKYESKFNKCTWATINVQLERRLRIIKWDIETAPIAWDPDKPDISEVFSFHKIIFTYQNQIYPAWIYFPHNSPNRSDLWLIEVLTQPIPLTDNKICSINIEYGRYA